MLNMLIKYKIIFFLIILLFITIIDFNIFSQSSYPFNTDDGDDIDAVKSTADSKQINTEFAVIEYVWGKMLKGDVGDNNTTQVVIGEKLGYDDYFILEANDYCVLKVDEHSIQINGPVKLRTKDIIERLKRSDKTIYDNDDLNKIAYSFINTNNMIANITTIRKNSYKDADLLYKKIMESINKGYYESGFTMAYEYITKQRVPSIRKPDPEIYKFYYLICEIAFRSLNLNIAQSAVYKILNDTEEKLNITQDRKVTICRMNTFFTASLIHSYKGEYDLSIEYLNSLKNNYEDDKYFAERMGYLTYYMSGANYNADGDPESALIQLKTAKEQCQSAINNNISNIRQLLNGNRTEETKEQLEIYYNYSNEASLILNYINDFLEDN